MGKSSFLGLVFCLLLSGCLHGLEQLKREVPNLQGSEFKKELAKVYLKFAQEEASQYDWPDSDYFAKKGLEVIAGLDVQPELGVNWDIPPTMLESLDQARELLFKTISEKAKLYEPKVSANAYFFYDCWIEQLEENWQIEHIDSCRNKFFETIDYLSVAVEQTEGKAVKVGGLDIDIDPSSFEIVKRDGGQGKDIPVEPQGTYEIFFDTNSAILNENGNKVIIKVIKDLESIAEYAIQLMGHADRVGKSEYNLKLSKLRAEAVKKALVERGVVARNVEIMAFGEDKPKVSTEDGESEPKNRIVEIFVF